MINGKRVIAIIPARGGSKGLAKKNIKTLQGKALIGWSIEAAQLCSYIDGVYVSTDCSEIADVATSFGANVPFLRPDDLASDTAKTCDAVKHFLTNLKVKFDILVLLQPTSPFRTQNHISEALKLFSDNALESVVSVCELTKSPFWSFWVDRNNKMNSILTNSFSDARRQDLNKAYALNGAIYIQNVEHFFETNEFVHKCSSAYIMDKRSSIDIDDEIDFKLAETLLEIQK